MSRNLPSTLNSQSGKLNLWEIMSWISEFIENLRFSFWFDVFDVLNERNPDIEQFMSMISSWAYSKVIDDSLKRSYAKDEWLIKLQDVLDLGSIKKLYENKKVYFWTNGDDVSNYRLETVFEWRKLVIVFYNSAYYKDRRKLSFKELVEKNEPVRVCLY